MSNYLVVVAPASTTARIARWLADPALPAGHAGRDLVRWPAADGHEVLIASRGAAADASAAEGTYLRGYGIHYGERRVVFGGRGARASAWARRLAAEAAEGCYLAAALDGGGSVLNLSNDLFGLLPVLATEGGGAVAFSDSTLLLTELRHALGLTVGADPGAARARTWGNAMAGQLLSPRGIVEQVELVPMGEQVAVAIAGRARLRRRRTPAGELFAAPTGRPYGELLRSCAADYVSLLDSLAGLGPGIMRLSVSGGLDSRANIATSLVSAAVRENGGLQCINNSPQHAEDYAVVKEMSGAFGFPLNRPSGRRPVLHKTDASLGYWMLSSSGIYDFLSMPGYYATGSARFIVGGHGAEIVKGQYGWRSIRQIARAIADPSLSAAFRAEAEHGLSAMGVDPADPIGSEWHYVGHRNAIHSGRFTQTSMIGMRPYMSRGLLSLERSGLSGLGRPRKGQPGLVHDLVACIHPRAAAFRYASEKNALPEPYVRERLAAIGGPLRPDELRPFAVDGEPGDVHSGYSELFRGVVERRGLWLAPDRETLLGLVRSAAHIAAEHGLEEDYAPVFADARQRLADETVPLRFTRASTGKALALHLLA